MMLIKPTHAAVHSARPSILVERHPSVTLTDVRYMPRPADEYVTEQDMILIFETDGSTHAKINLEQQINQFIAVLCAQLGYLRVPSHMITSRDGKRHELCVEWAYATPMPQEYTNREQMEKRRKLAAQRAFSVLVGVGVALLKREREQAQRHKEQMTQERIAVARGYYASYWRSLGADYAVLAILGASSVLTLDSYTGE